ncbi:MFS transporter [Ktedonosporobacter rubrisoli]|nr:MFS transporter [Ktedonosporobacter rubrisoli]
MKALINEQQQATRPPTFRFHLALSFLAFIMIGANDGALGVLLPGMQNYYHVDKAIISLLFLCSTLGYFIASFNNGLLIEKLGKQRALMLGTAIFLGGTVVLSLAPPFALALGAFLLGGFGIAMLDAGLNSYVAELPNNTTKLNYLHFFYGIGAWLGPIVASGLLAAQLGWNSAYMAWCGFSFLVLLALGLVFKDHASTKDKTEKTGKDNLLLSTLKLRVVWVAALFLLIYVGAEVSLGNWGYSFLVEERHGSTLISGWVISGYWLGLSLGRLILGHLGAKIGNKNLIQLCLLGVVIGLLLIWLVPVEAASAIGICLTGFCLGPIFPTTIALMPSLVSGRVLATAIGFLASLGSMGAALFPWLAGNLAQYAGLWSLLPYVIILTIVMLGLWLLLQRRPDAEAPASL